jgi:hypothetical protein
VAPGGVDSNPAAGVGWKATGAAARAAVSPIKVDGAPAADSTGGGPDGGGVSATASRRASIARRDSDGGIQEVVERMDTPACITLHPEKPFRVVWEAVGLLVIVWVTMSLPFKLA